MTPHEGDTILIRHRIASVGPDGWMTVVLPTDDGREQHTVINERDPAIEDVVVVVEAVADEVA